MKNSILPIVIIGFLAAASFCTILANSGLDSDDSTNDNTSTILMLLMVGVLFMFALSGFVPRMMSARRQKRDEKLRKMQQSRLN